MADTITTLKQRFITNAIAGNIISAGAPETAVDSMLDKFATQVQHLPGYVSEAEIESVQAEAATKLAGAQQINETLTGQLSAALAEKASLTAEVSSLQSVQAELEQTKSELATALTNNVTLQQELDAANQKLTAVTPHEAVVEPKEAHDGVQS